MYIKFIRFSIKSFDLIVAMLFLPWIIVARLYRRIGAKRLPISTAFLRRTGVFPIIDNYYDPLFNNFFLSDTNHQSRKLPGLDLNVQGQLEFISKMKFDLEFKNLQLESPSSYCDNFMIDNGSFEAGDADFLYQFIRHVKPKKIIEIGCGNSTKVARLAINENELESAKKTEHICIEPFEQKWLAQLSGIKLIREKLEKIEFNWRSELEAGDLLFIDSSHIIRPQGDVLKLYLEIIPLLSSGVYVHIHDIFTPRDYLQSWIVDEVRFWNEQYLLEALLTDSDRYQVVAALNFLKNNYFDQLSKICPYLKINNEPGSFYIKIL